MHYRRFLPYTTWLLTGVASCLVLTSCEDKQAQITLTEAEEKLSERTRTSAKLEAKLKSERELSEKRQRELLQENQELQRASDEIKARFEHLEDEVSQARQDLLDHKAKYKLKARATLKGTTIPRLETTDKTVFEKVTVREITPEEVAFAHANGVSRVALAKLPRNLQQSFLFDADDAKTLEETKKVLAQITQPKATTPIEVASAQEKATGAKVDILEQEVAAIQQKDPARPINAMAVMNLRKRITTRQEQIIKNHQEAQQVKDSGYATTNLGKYRLQIVDERVAKLRGEIKRLVTMLDKELNG